MVCVFNYSIFPLQFTNSLYIPYKQTLSPLQILSIHHLCIHHLLTLRSLYLLSLSFSPTYTLIYTHSLLSVSLSLIHTIYLSPSHSPTSFLLHPGRHQDRWLWLVGSCSHLPQDHSLRHPGLPAAGDGGGQRARQHRWRLEPRGAHLRVLGGQSSLRSWGVSDAKFTRMI